MSNLEVVTIKDAQTQATPDGILVPGVNESDPASAPLKMDLGAMIDLKINEALLALGPQTGDVKVTAQATPPNGWLFLNGQVLDRLTYLELSLVLGADQGLPTFTLPDMRGRFLKGKEDFESIVAEGGLNANLIDIINLPSHNHSVSSRIRCLDDQALNESSANHYLANSATAVTMENVDTYSTSWDAYLAPDAVEVTESNVGGDVPLDNRPAFTSFNFIIKA